MLKMYEWCQERDGLRCGPLSPEGSKSLLMK